MEIQFTPEQEGRLEQIASVEGIAPERLEQSAVLLVIEDDERFRAAVRKGIEQADPGMFNEEAEMDARIARMLNPGCDCAGPQRQRTTWSRSGIILHSFIHRLHSRIVSFSVGVRYRVPLGSLGAQRRLGCD